MQQLTAIIIVQCNQQVLHVNLCPIHSGSDQPLHVICWHYQLIFFPAHGGYFQLLGQLIGILTILHSVLYPVNQ